MRSVLIENTRHEFGKEDRSWWWERGAAQVVLRECCARIQLWAVDQRVVYVHMNRIDDRTQMPSRVPIAWCMSLVLHVTRNSSGGRVMFAKNASGTYRHTVDQDNVLMDVH